MLLGEAGDCGSPSMETGGLRTAVSLCPKGGPESRTCKEAILWSSRLKLQPKECRRWRMEERKLQLQPEKKLGQTKNNIFLCFKSTS